MHTVVMLINECHRASFRVVALVGHGKYCRRDIRDWVVAECVLGCRAAWCRSHGKDPVFAALEKLAAASGVKVGALEEEDQGLVDTADKFFARLQKHAAAHVRNSLRSCLHIHYHRGNVL